MQETSDLNEKLLVKDFDEGKPPKIDMSKIFNNEYNTSEHASEKYFKENLKNVEFVGQMFKTDFQNGLSTSNKADLEWREREWETTTYPQRKRTLY